MQTNSNSPIFQSISNESNVKPNKKKKNAALKIFLKLQVAALCILFASTICYSSKIVSNTSVEVGNVIEKLTLAEYTKALNYAKLASQAYSAFDNDAVKTGMWATYEDLPEGMIGQSFDTPNYEVIGTYAIGSLDATLFEKMDSSGEVVLAFRGTSPGSPFDWAEDIKQFKGISEQYETAIELAINLKKEYSYKLSFTGHSLGGGLAQAAALATGLEAICFDAAGLSEATIEKYGLVLSNAKNINHFNVKGDWVSDHNEQMDDSTLNTPPYRKFPHTTLPECKQYGEQHWLEKIEPSSIPALKLADKLDFLDLVDDQIEDAKDFATALLNHSWHGVTYQLENQNFYDTIIDETIQTKMSALANEAVIQNGKDRLDYEPDSIKVIESILADLWDSVHWNSLPENEIIEKAEIYGAYIGEVIRRQHGGHWAQDGNGFYSIISNNPLGEDTVESTPKDWCYDRMVHGLPAETETGDGYIDAYGNNVMKKYCKSYVPGNQWSKYEPPYF